MSTAPQPKTFLLSQYKATPYEIVHTELKFELEPTRTLVDSQLTVRARSRDQAGSLVLAGEAIELISVAIDGKPLAAEDYEVDDHELRLKQVPAECVIAIRNSVNPQDNLSLEGLYLSQGNFCTQCEAEGFRRITYFYDRPDVMSTYRVTVIADKNKYPVLLSNGNCLDEGDLNSNRHYTVWDDPFPKPCYLFALVAGNFAKITDHFQSRSGRSVELAIYAKEQDIDKCDFAMQSLKRAMRWDEEVYGLECDLDQYMIVAIGDFNMGAMENKGLNVFNTALVLAKPETATDSAYSNIEAVIGHEYFHNWTGNRVTCRDWFQLCLKEGLTVFRDQEFSADMGSRSVKRIEDTEHLRLRQWPEDDGPMAHPPRPHRYIEINNFYTMTVYYKGAEVVRMLHTLIGKEAFRKGMDLYFARHDGKAVTQEDFVSAMADASGMDLNQFMLWYTETGTPRVTVHQEFDASLKTLTLRIKQGLAHQAEQTAPYAPRHIPLRLALLAANGSPLPLQLASEDQAQGDDRLFSLRAEEEELRFVNVAQKPVASLFRGFSAAVKVDADYSDADLQFLMSHDSDPCSNWDAAQSLYSRALLQLVADHQSGRSLQLNAGLAEAFGRLLNTPRFEPAFKALSLALPSEKMLAQHMPVIDVDAIRVAREFVRKQLAQTYEAELRKLYETMSEQGDYSTDAAAVGRRSLKNRCLSILHALGREDIYALIAEQFQRAHNMTDVDYALGLLADSASELRAGVLDSFYKKWQHEDLVIDRWFAVQAAARRPSTLAEVGALLKHPDFKLVNPNRIRALLATFCLGNPSQFHDRSGKAYRLCAEYVITIDRTNRQMASHLARAFDHWRRYDETRQGLMKEQLQYMLAAPKLSPDVFEVVSRALDA